MSWTRSRFLNEYVPGLFTLAVDTYVNKKKGDMWSKLATVKSSAKKKEERGRRSGLGLPQSKAEGAPITYDVQIAGPKQSWIHTVFALGVRITEEAIDDNLYELKGGGGGDGLKEIFADLGDSLARNPEVKMARFFNYGTATTYHTTDGSKALFATDHATLDGNTYSNKATASDLTYSTFWTNLIAAENQVNERNLKINKKVTKLWVPPQLEKSARGILYSTDDPSTANRSISAYAQSGRKIELCVWPEMTDADMWVLQLEGDGIIYFWRRKTRFAREGDFQTGDMMCKGDQRFSAEINDPRCFYGNVPS